MTTTERTRDEILADLAKAKHEASRMTVVDPGYKTKHERLNELLDELEGDG